MSDNPTTTEPVAAPSAPEPPKPQAPQPTAQEPTPRDAAEAPLGEAGLKALREERAARERLEQTLSTQRTALLKAFGVEQEKSGEDIVTTLQNQFSALQKNMTVESVARRHEITDEGDVELLRAQPDEPSMARLAVRLQSSKNNAPTSPAPDPSQASAPLTPEAQAAAAYEAFFPSKT